MILVDSALDNAERQGKPIRVGLIGAGYMGRGLAIQIVHAYNNGMRLSAIYNRTQSKAHQAYTQAGITNFACVDSQQGVEQAINTEGYCVSSDPLAICQADNIDVIVEATGEVEFGARVVTEAIKYGKHVILMNAELDALCGPLLQTYADKAGVVISNVDGDQPGVTMNLFRWVKQLGYEPRLAGNIKGLQDRYRNPETQKGFAEQHKQGVKMITSFADGTKISMETAVLANATGFGVHTRGMHGPRCDHATDALTHFSQSQLEHGTVDYILGAEPGPGVFIVAYNENAVLQQYAQYLKMGDGPYYVFYVPYHLPHLETPNSIARAALFSDATIKPLGRPVVQVLAAAKTDLAAGTVLDGIGGFHAYGMAENADTFAAQSCVPMSLLEGCKLKQNVDKDTVITYEHVTVPEGRLSDKLWHDQSRLFS
jgi:predicted homoserine dehydrogenase-like protein